MRIKKLWEKTDIEKEFDKNEEQFIVTIYRDGKPCVWQMNNTDTLSFNIWSHLTKAEPLFDEIRVRVATEEDIEEWYGTPFEGSEL